jgi:aldehyde dehydrogenase
MNQMTKVELVTGSPFKTRYDNFIGGKFTPPVNGRYFDNVTPITGATICEVARSDAADINLALDAAHAAREAWGKTSAAHRANILLKIADRI